MKSFLLLIFMLFFHIVDDYYLQGWFASAKQREWWKNNAPNDIYKNDYLMALAEHSFSWCFMVHLVPIYCFISGANNFPFWLFLLSFSFNLLMHALTDDLKANKKKINLIQDQLTHITQVLIIWALLIA